VCKRSFVNWCLFDF